MCSPETGHGFPVGLLREITAEHHWTQQHGATLHLRPAKWSVAHPPSKMVQLVQPEIDNSQCTTGCKSIQWWTSASSLSLLSYAGTLSSMVCASLLFELSESGQGGQEASGTGMQWIVSHVGTVSGTKRCQWCENMWKILKYCTYTNQDVASSYKAFQPGFPSRKADLIILTVHKDSLYQFWSFLCALVFSTNLIHAQKVNVSHLSCWSSDLRFHSHCLSCLNRSHHLDLKCGLQISLGKNFAIFFAVYEQKGKLFSCGPGSCFAGQEACTTNEVSAGTEDKPHAACKSLVLGHTVMIMTWFGFEFIEFDPLPNPCPCCSFWWMERFASIFWHSATKSETVTAHQQTISSSFKFTLVSQETPKKLTSKNKRCSWKALFWSTMD